MTSPLAAALTYAGLGWPVMPLYWPEFKTGHDGTPFTRCGCGRRDCPSVAKHPIGQLAPQGLRSATTDAETITRWWTQYPNAGVGIVTGAVSGLVVLDVDPRHGGAESLDEITRSAGNIKQTLRAVTGSGGAHLVYRHPGYDVRNSAGRVGPGLDVRGDGGYIVAPPSVHATGQAYRWDNWGEGRTPDAKAAPMPGLIAPMDTAGATGGASASGAATARVLGQTIPHGTQHHTLVSIAGTLRRRGLEAAEIHACLAEVNKRCERPGQDAALWRIAESVMRYAPEDALGFRGEDVEADDEESPFTTIGDIARDVLDEADRVASGGTMPGVTTSSARLDVMLGGLQPAELIVLGARPSMGKSSFAFQMAQAVAAGGKSTVIFSLEMSKRALGQRFVSRASGVSTTDLRSGRISDEGWTALARGAASLSPLPLYVCDKTALKPSSAERYLDALIDQTGAPVGVVFVDYLQMMRGDAGARKGFDRDEEQIAAVSLALKGIARRFDCPVVALAQLSRDLEKRPDKRPMLSDLRQSGQIEQDADVVLFVHRPEKYGEGRVEIAGRSVPSEGLTEIVVAKQRMGELGSVWLQSDLATATYTDVNPLLIGSLPAPARKGYAPAADAF